MKKTNLMEDGMAIASAIYHLNCEDAATKTTLKEHPLLQKISVARLEKAMENLLYFGVVQLRQCSGYDEYDYVYTLSSPDNIRQYMESKGWLKVQKTFTF